MNLNILVVTKYRWTSRIKKHNTIKDILKLGKFKNVSIATIHKDLGTPEIVDGRITQKWFEENISRTAKLQDYDFAIFQFSEKDGRKWGLESGIRGTNFIDDDFFGEAWVCADENSTVKFKDGSERDKYSKTVPHEIAHELKRQGYTTLDIHHYDFKNDINNLEQFYIDFSKTVLQNLLTKVAALKIELDRKLSPVTELQPLVKRMADSVVKEMANKGLPVRIVEGYRSFSRQNELYAQGRTSPGKIVTKSRAGESFHNYGVAVDFVFTKLGYEASKEDWNTLGAVLRKHNFVWGGDWKVFVDQPHGEMTLGRSLSDFQNRKVDYSIYK